MAVNRRSALKPAIGLALALLAAWPAWSAAAPAADFSLDGQVEVLPDPAGHWTLDEVSQAPLAAQFRASPQPVFNGGFTRVAHWFRVTIPANVPAGDWLLELGYPLLDRVDLYLPRADGGFRRIETGDQRPFSERPVWHRNFVVPLALVAGTPRTVYLRVDTESTLQLPLHLWSEQAFLEKSQDEQYLLGLYYGIMLVMMLYNLLVYLLVRDISYLYYILYIAMSASLQAALNGLSAQYLYYDSPYLTNLSLPLSLAGTVLFATLFTHSFLDTRRHVPVLNRVLLGLFGLCALCTVAMFWVPYSVSIRLTSVLAGSMSVLFFITGFRALMRGVRAARFFLLAWGVYLVAIQVRVLLGFGLVPTHFLTLYSPQIGAALEVALLALALADRITIERAEKERLGRERAVAQAATEAKSEFLARMSHEIRTPINAVTGFADLALRTADEPQRLDYLRQIRSASRSLLTIINDILDMSRVEAGKLALSPQDFRMGPLLDAVRDLFAAQAADKKVELKVSAAADVPAELSGDPVRLEQVLVNLVANALKFTERGSVELRVTVVAAGADDTVLLFEVADTGIGIPAPQRVRLFEPFSQGDESITRRYGGTGLGLAICKQLVELMGGQIGVDSVPGEGSHFHFTVRLRRATGLRHDTQPDDAPLPQFPGARVLVVEDNPLNQRLAQEMLAGFGARPALAGNGFEALEAVQREPFDAVLMDVQMPEMDGLEATRRIRLVPAGKGLPIIAMTAHALAGSREQCEAAGMNDFLGKPVTARGLAAVLGRWLTAVPGAARPADASDLPESLPGLRLREAVRRLGGNAGLVRTSLLEFQRDYAGIAGAIDRALQASNVKEATRLAHMLKGIGANLSMPEVEAAARFAEQQLVEGGTLAPARLEALGAALATAVASCARIAPPAAAPEAALSADQLDDAFAKLRALVERNDFSAQAQLQRCLAPLRERCGAGPVQALAAALGAFDFAAARAPLEVLARQMAAGAP